MLESFEKKPMIWWRYIDDVFFIWVHDEEHLKVFIEQINMFHSIINSTAEYSKEDLNFLDVNIKLNVLTSTSCHPYHCKKGMPHSQALRLKEFVQITRPLIDTVMIRRNGLCKEVTMKKS